MLEMKAHPNTKAIIEAWKRLSKGDSQLVDGPMADDYPDLVGRLFILQHDSNSDFSFRVAGSALEDLFDRELVEHNFLSLWRLEDRHLITAAIESCLAANAPSIVQACGASLDGRTINVEIALAPLASNGGRPRVPGLYQSLSDERMLQGRPIWRHWATGVFPPRPTQPFAQIRLIASNDL